MIGIPRLQLSLLIIVSVCRNSPLLVRTFPLPNEQILHTSRIQQKILLGPQQIHAYPGETIHFPCFVSKQSDAVVTWCWNDFCTLGKTKLIRHELTDNGLISIHQYIAYPRFHLLINERLNHYNLSIVDVSNADEGSFQCQIQRTRRANEARSERAQLNLIVPPSGRPTFVLPPMPLKQGQSAHLTCLSSPSKPASKLMFYKNNQILIDSIRVSYQLDATSNNNLTKIVYTIDDPDGSWDNAIIRCEQLYPFEKKSGRDVKEKVHVYYKPQVRIESQTRSPSIVNSTATFRCIVHGNPEPEFRWFANSVDLISMTSPIISIPLSKHVHNHSIGCTARNSIGTSSTSLRLLVQYPPMFIIRPSKLFVLDLESRSPRIVRCLVDSYPRARISWYRYGELIGEGSILNLENITKRDEQGLYSYRIETEGFETIKDDFIVYIKGKPLIYIEESKKDHRIFECQVYSTSPILRITWKLNDRLIQSNDQVLITTKCDQYGCISKLVSDYRKISSALKTLNRLSCIGENEFGIEQSRLYQINRSSDPSIIFVIIILITSTLIILFSLIAIYCCCRIRYLRQRHERIHQKNLPIVYDEHYSINELLKEVGSLRTCSNHTLKIESPDGLLTTLFNTNTKKFLDNLSADSPTNSSGFHSKSSANELGEIVFSSLSPLYANQQQID